MALAALLGIAAALCSPAFAAAAAGGGPARSVRLLLPSSFHAARFDRELDSLVEKYNREHPAARVEILRRGEDYSAIRELAASQLAGSLPDLVAIDPVELPVLESMRLAPALPSTKSRTLLSGLAAWTRPSPPLLPFTRSTLVLVADQEILFRLRVDPEKLPRDWKGILALAGRLGVPDGSLALPLQGTRGLIAFEALAGKPLWSREPGGLRANRALLPAVRALRSALSPDGPIRAAESWDQALREFLDRKRPLLVAPLDALPYVQSQAAFRWTAVPLPSLGGAPPLSLGSDLAVLRDDEPVRQFLDFLYSEPVASRWTAAGAFLPLKPSWSRNAEWKRTSTALPSYRRLARLAKPSRMRSSDREVVRARTAWTQALGALFGGDPAARPAPDSVFDRLDRQLNP